MIRDIEIRDLVVISRAEIDPGPGLTAVTGESGAGKSVLAKAFGLLLGAPAAAAEVRPGARAALVQATLGLPDGFWDALPDDDPAAPLADLVDDPREVVLARRIPAEGRARSLVDGQAAPRDAVAALVRARLRLVGQAESRRLVAPAAQLAALDAFAGGEAVGLAADLARARRAVSGLARRITAARAAGEARARERADLESLLEEVRRLAPDAEEEAALRAERDRLRHAGRLLAAAGTVAESLSPESGEGGALAAVGEATRILDDVLALDPRLDGPRGELATAEASLQEAAIALRGYAAGLESEPGRLDAVEGRLDEYARLARRHGSDVESLVARATEAEERLAELDADAGELDRLAAEQAAALARARETAERLTELRTAAAPRLGEAMAGELAGLAMPDARVEVTLARDDADPPVETCTISLQVNPGLPAAPLSDAASGGALAHAPGAALARRRRRRRRLGVRRGRLGRRWRDGGRRRQAARPARRGAPGARHHAPAPGGGARGPSLSAGQGRRRRGQGAHVRGAGRRRRSARRVVPHARRIARGCRRASSRRRSCCRGAGRTSRAPRSVRGVGGTLRTVLLTGAAGFIGSHLAEALVADGVRVRGVDVFTDYYPRERKVANLAGLAGEPRFTLTEADVATTRARVAARGL